ncbi:hypothetical protein [Isoalcanivorax beigongshangi]|uniref:DUF945 domain-containing protein n=1 Tax=Isoalcanivorax beigongshangi TaxID=3238810 RepID=A0ABV4AJ02_9GAMM
MRAISLCVLGAVLALAAAIAHAVSDDTVAHWAERYRDDPGALGAGRERLADISPAQFDRVLEQLQLTPYTHLAPVAIAADRLPMAQGRRLEQLSVMAVRGGQLVPIPFQIDEYDREGLVWAGPRKGRVADGEPGRFDAHDEVLMMYRDAGIERYRRSEHGALPGSLLAELTLHADGQPTRHAYLLQDAAPRSNVRYVALDLEHGTVDTTLLSLRFNPDNLAQVTGLAPRLGPDRSRSLLDALHLELSTGVLHRALRITLDNRANIRAVPLATAVGPIRASVLLEARVWYLGMPMFWRETFALHFYEQGVGLPLRLSLNKLGAARFFVSMLREPRMELRADLSHPGGAEISFQRAWQHQQRARSDGRMDSAEQALNQYRLPGDWVSIDSKRGLAILFDNRIPITEGGLLDDFLDGAELHMLYRDRPDAAGPQLGFAATGLPPRLVKLLGAIPKLPKTLDQLGAALAWIDQHPDPSLLRDFDELLAQVLSAHRPPLANADDLYSLLVEDIRRMRFAGLDSEALMPLVQRSLRAAAPTPTRVDHRALLHRIRSDGAAVGVDLDQLRHVQLDNAFWFPHRLDDPAAFHAAARAAVRVNVTAPSTQE